MSSTASRASATGPRITRRWWRSSPFRLLPLNFQKIASSEQGSARDCDSIAVAVIMINELKGEIL
uniref:Uncharacterized protein n=1 Tax=mine drainage metagenome TaxID=410659 RepID=E6QNH4_9ZZZZ